MSHNAIANGSVFPQSEYKPRNDRNLQLCIRQPQAQATSQFGPILCRKIIPRVANYFFAFMPESPFY
jgi:hypothetical protein